MFKYTFGEIMSSKHVFGFTIEIQLLFTLYLNDFTLRALADSTLECPTNYYNDGNGCKECPAGYYGDKCLEVCPSPKYGIRCALECDCLPCHHAYGCPSTPLTEETASSYFTARDKREDKKQAQGNKLTTSSRIIIISIGSVLCFILILVIIRELWLCCQFPQRTGKRTVSNDVHEDIAEIDSVRVESNPVLFRNYQNDSNY